jgi:hypothetical protein
MNNETLEIREFIDKVKFLGETRLSRLWQHVENRRPFAMISLSRSAMSEDEKTKAYVTLKNEVRKLGYGFIELKGGYVEGEIDVVDELSLMIPNIDRQNAIKLGQIDLGYGPQDTVLYCDGVDFLGYIVTSPEKGAIGSVNKKFVYGKGHDALPMVKSAVEQYFSMLAKGNHANRKFSFIPENFKLMEMADRRSKHNENGSWWDNFGFYI